VIVTDVTVVCSKIGRTDAVVRHIIERIFPGYFITSIFFCTRLSDVVFAFTAHLLFEMV
jgi:hypothetical protein